MIRKLGSLDIIQRTKDSMFNATALLKQWNYNPLNPKRDLSKFWESSKVNEFLEALVDEGIIDTPKQGYVKSRASRGENAGTWMHPYLFIKFAMWLNPRFEVQVIRFVYDQLIEHRHLAGDNYKKLCNALAKFIDVDFREVGKMLNYVVFNTHEQGLRNKATTEQENDLQQLERDMCRFIEMGFINTYAQFKKVLRKEWHKRHGNVPVALT